MMPGGSRRRITVDPDALEDRAFTDGLTIEADGDWMVCVIEEDADR